MDEIYRKALALLAVRDYTAAELAGRLGRLFPADPAPVIARLKEQGALNDRRFAENFASRKAAISRARLREELIKRGVDGVVADAVLRETDEMRPSLREALNATMVRRKIQTPLTPRDAGRLFRALSRLGYPEDDIREELERFHDQQ